MIVTSHRVELQLPPNRAPRSPGVHLSRIIRAIAISSGYLKPEWEEDTALIEWDNREWWAGLDEVARTRISMGLAWEEWYIPSQLPEALDHPGEMCINETYMTPDAEELTTVLLSRRNVYRLQMHEVKLTYKSLKTVGTKSWSDWGMQVYDSAVNPLGPLTSQWMWMAQTKGYCYGADTRFVDLHVLFACGDYSWPMRPIPYRYSIEFTEEEILTNWQLMMDYKAFREEQDAQIEAAGLAPETLAVRDVVA